MANSSRTSPPNNDNDGCKKEVVQPHETTPKGRPPSEADAREVLARSEARADESARELTRAIRNGAVKGASSEVARHFVRWLLEILENIDE